MKSIRDRDVIAEAARTSGRPKAEVARHYRHLIRAIRTGLREQGRVALHGFGAIENPVHHAADVRLRPSPRILLGPRSRWTDWRER